MLCLKRVAIKNTGQQNHPLNSAAICVHFVATKRAMYKCARYDLGLGVVPCFVEYHTRVNLYINLFVNTVCHDKTVIEGATGMKQAQL